MLFSSPRQKVKVFHLNIYLVISLFSLSAAYVDTAMGLQPVRDHPLLVCSDRHPTPLLPPPVLSQERCSAPLPWPAETGRGSRSFPNSCNLSCTVLAGDENSRPITDGVSSHCGFVSLKKAGKFFFLSKTTNLHQLQVDLCIQVVGIVHNKCRGSLLVVG